MAVLDATDPISVALDRLGTLTQEGGCDSLDGAVAIAALWRTVYDRAMDRVERRTSDEHDVALAMLAAGEWCKAIRVIRVLTTSPPL